MPAAITTQLPNGDEIFLYSPYSSGQSNGVIVLVVISCISLVAVLGLLGAIALSAFNTRSSVDQHLFVRTHVAAYFISLLFCDLAQAAGSIINVHWIMGMGVEIGTLCTVQGVLKQFSDVGTAVWTLVIAVHTFALLVLEVKLGRIALWATLVAGWALIGALVVAGPASQDTANRGPFFAISGYWCWISPTFPGARITLDYMVMFLAALFSALLYILTYLRVRGNFKVSGGRVVLNFQGASKFDTGISNDQAVKIARQMLFYPAAYTILILPIAVSRFTAWSGRTVPSEVTLFSAAVFLTSGLVNVVLFAATRNVLPRDSIGIRVSKASISKPAVLMVPAHADAGHDNYYGEPKMFDVDLNHQDKDVEKQSRHTRTTSDISQIMSPMQTIDNRMTYDVDRSYGGGRGMPSPLDDYNRPFHNPRESQGLQPPPTALSRNDRAKSGVDSMYDYYGDNSRSTMASFYQYNSGDADNRDFPDDLQRRATEHRSKYGP